MSEPRRSVSVVAVITTAISTLLGGAIGSGVTYIVNMDQIKAARNAAATTFQASALADKYVTFMKYESRLTDIESAYQDTLNKLEKRECEANRSKIATPPSPSPSPSPPTPTSYPPPPPPPDTGFGSGCEPPAGQGIRFFDDDYSCPRPDLLETRIRLKNLSGIYDANKAELASLDSQHDNALMSLHQSLLDISTGGEDVAKLGAQIEFWHEGTEDDDDRIPRAICGFTDIYNVPCLRQLRHDFEEAVRSKLGT